MKQDIVDELLDQWANERPGIDVSSLGIVVRIQVLAKLQQQSTTAALKSHGLKLWEYDVLSLLRRQGEPFELPATDIADAALLTSGAMTTRIDGLERRKLVSRRRSRSDKRSVLVRLTAPGKSLVDKAIHTRLESADELLTRIPQSERTMLATHLRKLIMDVSGSCE